MPRVARITIPGMAHHITQRGNNRQRVFADDFDRGMYLGLLATETQRHGVLVLAYCLMDNHVHLVAIPARPDSLARGLGRTHFRFTQIANHRHRRSGHLWQNRFFSCPIEGDHFWRALRYVERNPVRAGLVRRAWRYPWSSAAAHCGRTQDRWGLLDLDDWQRRTLGRDWIAELQWRETQEEMEMLQRHTQTGRPLVGEDLLTALEQQTGRRLRPRPVGRPRKETASEK